MHDVQGESRSGNEDPECWFQGVLKRMMLLSIVAFPFFAQDLLAQTLTISPSTLPQGNAGSALQP